MIVSHNHRLVFVKTRKTAGTSVEIALSRICGERDVITRLVPADEELRSRMGGRGPQNERLPVSAQAVAWALKRQRWPRVRNHSSISVARHLGVSGFRAFSIERNPWDRAVSLFHYLGSGGSFSQFLRSVKPDWLENFHLYSIDGRVAVDRVLRFESLSNDLEELTKAWDLPMLALPRAKSGNRPSGDFREMYTEADRDLVAFACRREIEAFGYTFDD